MPDANLKLFSLNFVLVWKLERNLRIHRKGNSGEATVFGDEERI